MYCHCNEKVIEIVSEQFRLNPSEYLDKVKGNTILRVIAESGAKLTISAPSIPKDSCEKCTPRCQFSDGSGVRCARKRSKNALHPSFSYNWCDEHLNSLWSPLQNTLLSDNDLPDDEFQRKYSK